jgi:hypothetical protein
MLVAWGCCVFEGMLGMLRVGSIWGSVTPSLA